MLHITGQVCLHPSTTLALAWLRRHCNWSICKRMSYRECVHILPSTSSLTQQDSAVVLHANVALHLPQTRRFKTLLAVRKPPSTELPGTRPGAASHGLYSSGPSGCCATISFLVASRSSIIVLVVARKSGKSMTTCSLLLLIAGTRWLITKPAMDQQIHCCRSRAARIDKVLKYRHADNRCALLWGPQSTRACIKPSG